MGPGEGTNEEPLTPYTISIRPAAEAELVEAYFHYEGKEEGLGAEFRRAVDACLEVVVRHPTAYQIVRGQVRRALLRRFPYGLFYEIDGQRIVVFACFHSSRHPKEWERRT